MPTLRACVIDPNSQACKDSIKALRYELKNAYLMKYLLLPIYQWKMPEIDPRVFEFGVVRGQNQSILVDELLNSALQAPELTPELQFLKESNLRQEVATELRDALAQAIEHLDEEIENFG